MKYKITRRDFLNGVAIGTGTTFLVPTNLFSQVPINGSVDYYPPILTGMRGNHEGSFEVSHALAWQGQKPENYRQLDEHYDLVIVGAGISGLAAAWFYQKKMGPDAKILLLDNHDDFGGHAKRNEFEHDGRMLLGVGGSVNMESPSSYSDITMGLLEDDLGIDFEALRASNNAWTLMPSDAENAIAFPGANGHVTVLGKWASLMSGKGDYESAIRKLPLPASEQDKLIELVSGDRDYLDELSLKEKYTYINETTYREFLIERVGLSEDTIPIFYPIGILLWGAAVARITILEAILLGNPGLRSMGWLAGVAGNLFSSMAENYESIYFPDGNSSVARLLVHKLIPSVAPNTAGFADIATSHFNYDKLDQDNQSKRLRLNSTVVGVREISGKHVEVDYVQDGNALQVTGNKCVLACYNAAIPFLCPELPEHQKEALRYGVKVPLVMTNVLVANGHAFLKLGAKQISCPKDPYAVVTEAPPIPTGGYQPPRDPNDPMVIYMLTAPTVEPTGNETGRELLTIARHNVYATTFETYEQQIRDQLQGLLGEHGFNHETDIKAITVNRWPHGYAYEYMGIDDPEWEEGQAPHEIGRAKFGRISIANSDSEAYAYLDAAIESGWRAIEEQTS